MRKFIIYSLIGASSVLSLPSTKASSEFDQSVGVSYFQLLNVKTDFGAQNPVLPSLSALSNRTYLDGYNKVDSSNNIAEGSPGLTSRTGNFGYSSNSQVNLTAGTIGMHTYGLPAGPYASLGNHQGSPSVELNYNIFLKSTNPYKLGLELRLADVEFSQSASGSAPAALNLVTDSYQLGGVVPPVAPYSGPFTVTAFTPRIGDTPTRSYSSVSGTAQGNRSISLKGYIIRLGAVGKWTSDDDKFTLEVHGGPTLASIKGSYSINDTFSSSAVSGSLGISGNGSRTKQMLGFYYGAAATYNVKPKWKIDLGLDELNVGHNPISSGSTYAKADLTQAILLHIGIGYRF